MKLKTDNDYVVIYAESLLNDNSLFEQQKLIIESQITASRELFKNKFGKSFKKNAREYLKDIKLIP